MRACVCRGAETQCPFIEVLKLRSWEPNAATLAFIALRYVKTRRQRPFIEILKPRSWEPNAATLAFIALRYVKTRRQQQKKRVVFFQCHIVPCRHGCVRPSHGYPLVIIKIIACGFTICQLWAFFNELPITGSLDDPIMLFLCNHFWMPITPFVLGPLFWECSHFGLGFTLHFTMSNPFLFWKSKNFFTNCLKGL